MEDRPFARPPHQAGLALTSPVGRHALSGRELRLLDHISLRVADVDRSRSFYTKALAPLGLTAVMTYPEAPGVPRGVGFGVLRHPFFWIVEGAATTGVHVAFKAESRAAVTAFYEAAMAAGGIDNGPPGLRPHYHPNYFAAFVRDPDGNNIEAVCQTPR